MAGNLCQISFYLECLLICVSAYCQNSDQSEKCLNPKELICVPDECGNLMYVCEGPFPVEPGKCPYYNKKLQRMDVTKCTAEQICPNVPYLASTLVEKSIDCLAKPKRTHRCSGGTLNTTTMMSTGFQSTEQHQTRPQESGGSGVGGVAAVVVALLIIVVVVVVLVVFYRRNLFGFKDKMEPLFDNIRNHLPGNREQHETRSDEETGVANEPEMPLLYDEETGVANEPEMPLLYVDKPMYATVSKDTQKKKDAETGKAGDTEMSLLQEEMKMRIRKLNILQRYLVHILKREIDVKDLKEKSIIHSKSLREHFTEPVLQDLNSVEKADDYIKLDMSLVFALLRNFCENVKPPMRGWDYEPPDEEGTVGADIERIRSMWNKYCDNNNDFKNLDDVFNRMKNKYGTPAVQNEQNQATDEIEGFGEIKEKIQSTKLNPDCSVEEGIVITEGIRSALQSLETGNVVICKGAIGCGKTHALKAIRNRYKVKGWKVRWMEESLLPLEENLKDETIVICDNLFGRYGCNTFSSNKISSIENLLEKMCEKSRNIKVAVGIHQHVFDEVRRNANLKLLQNKNITADLVKLTKSELLLILKEQQKEGHCKTDPSCWFKGVDLTFVIDKFKENQGHIGSPFLSLMYCHLHDLFSDEAFTKNPLQSLTQRFQKMRNDSSSIEYYSLVYLMCVRKHKYGDELTSWAGTLDPYLNEEALTNTASKMPWLIRVDNGVETLYHEVLTIALFKATAHDEMLFLPVVQNCEIEILLQLMRPTDSFNTEFSCGFANPKKNTQARIIGKHLVKRFADKFMSKWDSIEHPLKHHELFEAKFDHYKTITPKEKIL